MEATQSKTLSYAQLLRIPNVFTAIADPLAGWFVVGGGEPSWHLTCILGASACLYMSGIVNNDFLDYDLDREERPERVLPRGAISRRVAWFLGIILSVIGWLLAIMTGPTAALIASYLLVMIWLYNGYMKKFRVLGSLTLGLCRFSNFLLGMRCIPIDLLWMPMTIGVYAAIITYVARGEGESLAVRKSVRYLILGICAIDSIFVAMRGDWFGAGLVLLLIAPAILLSQKIEMT